MSLQRKQKKRKTSPKKKRKSENRATFKETFHLNFIFIHSSESESSDSQRSSTGKDFEILDAEEDEE